MDVKQMIEQYVPMDDEDSWAKKSFLQFLNDFPEEKWASRENLIGHLSSSAWVVNPARDKVLFAYHNIYQSWAWLGGHADGDLDLCRVAEKEAIEESGVTHVRLLVDKPIGISVQNVVPHVKRGTFVPSHLHFNAVFLFEADENEVLQYRPDESAGVAWIHVDELFSQVNEEMVKPIYARIMRRVKELGA